jgi:hypothetical protein
MELPVEFLQNLKLSFKIIPYDKFSQTYRLILVAQDSEWGSSDHVLAISQIRQQLDSQIRADPVKLYTWSLKRKNMDPAESSPSKKLNCSVLVSSKDSKDQKDHKS